MITADYLVVGAGAMGMAFTDVILAETEATVAIVDRRGRPGGHWNDAYPFVRLHQPSSFYGVNSRALGHDRIDEVGWNAGLYELASSAEVCAYFDLVMQEQFLPSGRVTYLPLASYDPAGTVTSLATGAVHRVSATKVVDATYQDVTIPAMRQPGYEVADGVRWGPINDLAALREAPAGYVIVGAGKTGMDACLWLLANGVDPDAITWLMPRDSWILDRANIQPGPRFVERAMGAAVAQMEASAEAGTIDDLFARLEAEGALLRLDLAVRPTMYRCATVTRSELDQLRRIERVVRLGRVQRLEPDRVVLDGGTIPTTPDHLHVDCSADGLTRRPAVPIFAGDRLRLQPVRTCQQVFSAAFAAHVEATRATDDEKNELCAVVAHPDSDVDWLRTFLASTLNAARWSADPELRRWLAAARLDAFSGARGLRAERDAGADGDVSGRQEAKEVRTGLTRRLLAAGPAAVENLQRLLAGIDDPVSV